MAGIDGLSRFSSHLMSILTMKRLHAGLHSGRLEETVVEEMQQYFIGVHKASICVECETSKPLLLGHVRDA
jgi:hypothetical protein